MPDILCETSPTGIATITLNRPEKRNVVRHAMWLELGAIAARLATDPQVRVVLMTGAGDHFCAGADITEFETLRRDEASAARFDADIEAAEEAIARLSKPTIAAISGYCIGGGVGLALCCDIRIARTCSKFSIPAAKLSVLYGLRDSQALFNAVGLAQAKRIMFTADRLDATEALRIGLVELTTDGDVKAEALAMATRIAANAPLSLSGSKHVLGAIARGETADRAGEIRDMQRRTHTSRDHHEAARAFSERRAPIFTGR
ncbi:MAG: enoyl-CoA hydratase/isomerase family protein [Hyphomicrobiaceae bacterium]